MTDRRSPLAVFLLILITLGAYWVYWHYRTGLELRARGELVRPAVSALAVSWGAFLVIPMLVSCWMTADRVKNQAVAAASSSPSRLLAMLLLIVGGYAPYLQSHLNRLPAR